MFNIIFIGKLYFKWEKKKHGFKCILHVKVNVMVALFLNVLVLLEISKD